ncbi:helix-turn-helix domain-containing protein [Flavobacterium difficile]|uniref:helix-turn-helix domain-containing protein n=1 Tax=Flavobacterium difficile TaxID=2709659 RepID=UPI00293BC18C|nr:helix-turn-helix transcriptional regulator [Flavobacterium difficile]
MLENLLQKRVGKKIKEIRVEKNISQQELADLCGIEPSNMSRLEAGRANATLATIEVVSKNLGIEPIELFRF